MKRFSATDGLLARAGWIVKNGSELSSEDFELLKKTVTEEKQRIEAAIKGATRRSEKFRGIKHTKVEELTLIVAVVFTVSEVKGVT